MKILFLSIFSFFSYAGQELGNGGDIVICRDRQTQNIISIELLDYHEGQISGYTSDLGDPLEDVESKVLRKLNLLMKYSPLRANYYIEAFHEFLNESKFVSNIELKDINDSKHIQLRRGCKIEQIAYQMKRFSPHESKYIISKDLWDSLDNNNKAGLILHEIIYKEFLNRTHQQDSRNVRKMNYFISSQDFSYIQNSETYESKLAALKLGIGYDL